MRSWLIILVSAAAATAATLFLLPGELPPISGFAEFFAAYWPSIAIPWLSVYGAVALVLNTVLVCREISKTPVYRSGYGWARHYLLLLAATQFFSSVIGLFLIGVSHLPVESEHYSVLLAAAQGFLPLV